MKTQTLFPLSLHLPVRWAASALAVAICLLLASGARAIDYTSTGSGNWSTATTWSPNGTPGAGDTATIASGTTVTLTANTVCSGVTINSGGVLDESSSVYTLSLAGNFVNNGTFKAGGTGPMVIFTTTGTTTATYQVTPGVASLTVECWGGGGAGGSVHVSSGSYGCGGGGAGGSYSKTQVASLTGGNAYTVQVGGGGSPVTAATGNAGGNSYFGNTTTAMAAGGNGGVGQSAYDGIGAGGAVGSGSTGTVNLGGAGAPGVSSNHHGGGGGAGAGSLGVGGAGALSVGGTGGSGGGGNGGNGSGTGGNAGASGSATGGGGGGAFGTNTAKDSSGGAGAAGKVVITWPAVQVNATKANNTDNLNLTTSWTGGAVPSSTGIATWDNTVTSANTVALGADLGLGGITIANPGGLVTISAGNTLTLNGPVDMSSATADLTLSCPLVVGATNTWNVASSRTLTLGGAISGSAGITKQGAGTVILSGTNTFNGTLTNSAGILSLGNSLALQTCPLNTDALIDGDASNGLQTTVINLTLGGLFGSKNFAASGGVFTANSGGYNSVTALTLNLGTGTNLNYSGNIADGATGMTLTKAGAGTQTLSGSNTYSGATTINAGTLVLNNLNAIANSATVAVASGTSLEPILGGTYANTGTVSVVGNGASSPNPGAIFFGNAGVATTIWNAPLVLGGATSISSYGVTMNQTLGGVIGGTGPLTINSRGGANTHTAVWTLNAASTYTGNTTIYNNNGLQDVTVMLGVANALPSTTRLNLYGATSMSGSTSATLDLNGFSQTLAGLTDTNSSSSSGTFGTRVINSSSTPATLTVNIASGTNTFGTTGTRVTAGTIGGSTAGSVAANNLALTKTGAGSLVLAGANTYTGNTTINGGILNAGSAEIAGTSGPFGNHLGTDAGTILFGGGTLQYNPIVNSYDYSGRFSTAGNQPISIDLNSAYVIYSTAIQGSGTSLTVNDSNGGGVLTLSGTDTYTGNTTIRAGTLVLNQPTLASSSTLSISNGAVLNLGFSTTNSVANLIINGVSQAAGVYNNGNLAPFITGSGSLQVKGSSGPSGPAKLTNSISGNTLSLSWPAGQGWRLQMQTNSLSVGLNTNWVYLTDGTVSSTNILTSPTNPTAFFRLTYP